MIENKSIMYIFDPFVVLLSLIIALVPEGIFLCLSKTIGTFTSLDLLRSKKLSIHNIGALEKMGHVDTIVFEKQGTLTDRDRMEIGVENWIIFGVNDNEDSNESYLSENDGENSDSERAFDFVKSRHFKNVNYLTECIFYGVTAWIEIQTDESKHLEKDKLSKFIFKGNFTEQAILRFLVKHEYEEYKRISQKKVNIAFWKPFDAERKRSTVVVEQSGKMIVLCKGVYESIFAICSHIYTDGDESSEEIT